MWAVWCCMDRIFTIPYIPKTRGGENWDNVMSYGDTKILNARHICKEVVP